MSGGLFLRCDILFYMSVTRFPISKANSTGIYSAIFAMYIQHIQYHASGSINQYDKRKIILLFAICALYILSIVTIILDLTGMGILLVSKN